jgi:hypothetical protein
MYQLTEAGREHARQLRCGGSEPSVRKAGLGREVAGQLKNLLASRAVEKVKNNRLQDVTFFDACIFWGITPVSSAIELQGKISNIEGSLESARKAIRGNMATFGHGGQAFGAQDLDTVLTTHRLLLERFRTEINIIRQRKDERKV